MAVTSPGWSRRRCSWTLPGVVPHHITLPSPAARPRRRRPGGRVRLVVERQQRQPAGPQHRASSASQAWAVGSSGGSAPNGRRPGRGCGGRAKGGCSAWRRTRPAGWRRTSPPAAGSGPTLEAAACADHLRREPRAIRPPRTRSPGHPGPWRCPPMMCRQSRNARRRSAAFREPRPRRALTIHHQVGRRHWPPSSTAASSISRAWRRSSQRYSRPISPLHSSRRRARRRTGFGMGRPYIISAVLLSRRPWWSAASAARLPGESQWSSPFCTTSSTDFPPS